MNHTNLTHALLQDASVTIRKGHFSVTVGPKQVPAAQHVTTKTVQPVESKPPSKPWTGQDVAFVLVLLFVLGYGFYRFSRWMEKNHWPHD